jgi:dipeptidyl aminopeptidase/acylaminoacyl peptidase
VTPLAPDRSNDAIWKQRYRRPELSGLQVARRNRDQAIVLNDTTGMTQAYGLDLRSGAMRQLTYRRASPITYAADLDAPLLVFQGSNDTRCPPGQFLAFEEAARASGKSVEVEWFDAGHIGPSTEQLIAFQERSLSFARTIFTGANE